MDVHTVSKIAIGLIAATSFFGCGQKSTSTVFPESKIQTVECSKESIRTRFIVAWEDGRISVEAAENKDVFVKNFLDHNISLVRHVEFDKRVYLFDQPEPSQPNTSHPDWGQTIIEAKGAWDQGVLGQGIKVAVVDSAVDISHPQLAGQLAENLAEVNGENGVDDDGNDLIDDKHGWDFFNNKPTAIITPGNMHGTHVAGIILADHTRGSVAGLAPKAKLIPVNFMDSTGGGNLSDAIMAIKYSVAQGARVINASWGGNHCSETLREVIGTLAQKNVLFVAAAGNEGKDLALTPEYPAAFDLGSQLTVGATRETDRLAAFSNTSFNLVHLAAPGDAIYSTVPGGYSLLSGTSMAAPFVSGAAALLWSAKPQATVGEIKKALMNSVDVRDYRVLTRGRLNVRKALEEIRRIVP